MGAVVNMRPELFRGVVAGVPFVDVITTMSDPTIPLTTNEYDEWGNPENEDSYRYMLSYSPYDNVKSPTVPQHAGNHRSLTHKCKYWEPAKWVAQAPRVQKPTTTNYYSIPTWSSDTAALPDASSSTKKPPWSTRLCWIWWEIKE